MDPKQATLKLHALRLTDCEIAEMVKSSTSSINKIRRGKMMPSWTVGAALVDLAKRKSK